EDDEATEDDGEVEEEDGTAVNGYNGMLNAHFNQLNVIINELNTLSAEGEVAAADVAALYTEIQMLQDTISAEIARLDGALQTEQQFVMDDVTDLKRYKKLAKLLGKKGIVTFVNGEEVTFDVPPVVKEGRALVPFRAIAEKLDAVVTWNAAEKMVIVTRGDIEVKLVIGSVTALINGEEVPLDVPANVENGHTVVPISFLAEALGAAVEWDNETSSIIVLDQ
ncbi:MAG: copper amine oxidase N-terminal domain-containing protein, partial [Paenibacillaceae bacterium]